MTKGRIEREGAVRFSDGKLFVWEEGIGEARAKGGVKGADEWESRFKGEVFTRVVQQLNRLGWACTVDPIDPHDVKHYGGKVARWAKERRRSCRKGDMQAELSISGRCIELQFWQDVQNVSNPNGGKYDFDKEARMTYLQRLEMNRTRNRIRDYLCNVFTGYTFEPRDPSIGPMGVTAEEMAAHRRRTSGHYVPELDRARIHSRNDHAADGGTIFHGAKVWVLDSKGRIVTGTAYYDLNSTWQIVTGRYGLFHAQTGKIFTRQPENLRIKRNASDRRKRLEREMQKAIERMNFERAATLRDILFPNAPALYVVWNKEHELYHRPGFCGYTSDKSKAGRFTTDEVRGWDNGPNQVMPAVALQEAA